MHVYTYILCIMYNKIIHTYMQKRYTYITYTRVCIYIFFKFYYNSIILLPGVR